MTYRLEWTLAGQRFSQCFNSRTEMSNKLVIIRSIWGVTNIVATRVFSNGDTQEL